MPTLAEKKREQSEVLKKLAAAGLTKEQVVGLGKYKQQQARSKRYSEGAKHTKAIERRLKMHDYGPSRSGYKSTANEAEGSQVLKGLRKAGDFLSQNNPKNKNSNWNQRNRSGKGPRKVRFPDERTKKRKPKSKSGSKLQQNKKFQAFKQRND